MRCPECNKFVGFDDGNVDEVEVEIDEDSGAVTVTGRVVLPCAECGTELKELSVDETVETADEFDDVLTVLNGVARPGDPPDVTQEWADKHVTVSYELDGDPDTEFHERTQTTVQVPIKKKGVVVGYRTKPIKSARYMKTFKGVAVSGTVKRTLTIDDPTFGREKVEETAEFEHEIEEQSSAFDELV